MAKKSKSNFGKGFNKEQERKGTFTPLPVDTYFFQCIKSEDVENSKGTGRNYKSEWKVLKGEFKNRTLKLSYSYDNPNEQTVNIALGAMASMCDAAGIKFEKFSDPKLMLKKKIQMKLSVTAPEKGSQYGPQNDVIEFLPFDAEIEKSDSGPDFEEGKKKKKKKKKD